MSKFDFISGDDFRTSLENDYQELESAMKTEAWKTVLILAGSIIEAILIDSLIAYNYQTKASQDPLKMALNDAISACRKEGIISERTEHLSHVIRSYRNLIHPGRSIRLNEKANESGAKVAEALLQMVIDEISTDKKANYGYTSEQILKKIEADPSVEIVLDHILKSTSDPEKERLLTSIIPERYIYLESHIFSEDSLTHQNALISLSTSFRIIFATAPELIKEKVAANFIKVLREEGQSIIGIYQKNFFRVYMIQYLSSEQAELAIKYLLSLLKKTIRMELNKELLESLEGIGVFIKKEQVGDFIAPLITELLLNKADHEKIIDFIISEYSNMHREVQEHALRYFTIEKWEFSGPEEILREFIETVEKIRKIVENIYNYVDVEPF